MFENSVLVRRKHVGNKSKQSSSIRINKHQQLLQRYWNQ